MQEARRPACSGIAEEYLKTVGSIPLEMHQEEFEGYLQRIGKFRPITPEIEIFEVGVGTGWFLLLCAMRGLRCRGLELNSVFAQHARQLGRAHGYELDIEEGSVEQHPLGEERYDVVFASSVFEHVRNYEAAARNVYRALRPGGVFYFYSTNKFSLGSGEYPALPLYGWLPNRVRYRFRVWRQGEDIVQSSGIDFNQFTYGQLTRLFRRVGFSTVLDWVAWLQEDDIIVKRFWKVWALRALRNVPAMRAAARTFASGNNFICVK